MILSAMSRHLGTSFLAVARVSLDHGLGYLGHQLNGRLQDCCKVCGVLSSLFFKLAETFPLNEL